MQDDSVDRCLHVCKYLSGVICFPLEASTSQIFGNESVLPNGVHHVHRWVTQVDRMNHEAKGLDLTLETDYSSLVS
jgi:hypothetical protein